MKAEGPSPPSWVPRVIDSIPGQQQRAVLERGARTDSDSDSASVNVDVESAAEAEADVGFETVETTGFVMMQEEVEAPEIRRANEIGCQASDGSSRAVRNPLYCRCCYPHQTLSITC